MAESSVQGEATDFLGDRRCRERAEQEGRVSAVGGCRIPFEGRFQGGSLKACRLCEAVVFPPSLSIIV